MAAGNVFTQMHWSVLDTKLDTSRQPSTDLQNFLWTVISSSVLFSVRTLVALVSPDSQMCLFDLGNQWTLFAFPLPEAWPGKSLKAVSWENCRTYLLCLASLTDHCSLFTGVQCLTNCYFIWQVYFLVVSVYRLNPASLHSLGLKLKSSEGSFLWWSIKKSFAVLLFTFFFITLDVVLSSCY